MSTEAIQVNVEQEVSETNINVKRFKSPVLHTSRKKLIYITRLLKGFTLKKSIAYLYCLNKRYAKYMHKFFKDTVNNIVNQYKMTPEEAELRIIKYIVLEKTSNKTHSLRYAAKGRAYRTTRISTRLNAYIY